jgi:hypothetical protein
MSTIFYKLNLLHLPMFHLNSISSNGINHDLEQPIMFNPLIGLVTESIPVVDH